MKPKDKMICGALAATSETAVERIKQLSLDLKGMRLDREYFKEQSRERLAIIRNLATISSTTQERLVSLEDQLLTERRVRKERRLRQREEHSEAVEILLARVAFLEGELSRRGESAVHPSPEPKRYWVTNTYHVEIWDEEPVYSEAQQCHAYASGNTRPLDLIVQCAARDRGVPFPPKDSPKAIEWIPLPGAWHPGA